MAVNETIQPTPPLSTNGVQSSTPSSIELAEKNGSEDPEFAMTKRAKLATLTLCVLALMAALDSTSISVALAIISDELHGTAIEAFWAGTCFLLCSTVLQPSFASFSNIFGRRPLVLIAITFFFVGAVVACVAKNFTYLLVGRAIQGIGGGGIIALTEVIITDIVPMRLRGDYYGIMNAMWAIGSVTGPILGGGLRENVSWRWIFYINFPFIGVGVVLVLVFLRLNFVPTTLLQKLRRVDYIGTFLFVASTISFLIPLTWGGVMFPWSSWRTLVPLILGVFGWLLFAIYEYRFAADPIVPPVIFKTRTALVSYIGTTLQGLALWCLLYYMPLYFEAVKEYSPVIAGVSLFPTTFTVAPAAGIAGALITKTGKYRMSIWVGWALSTLGLGLLCIINVNTSVPGWIFLNLVGGVGLGVLFPSIIFSIQSSAAEEHLAIAVAMFSFFRALGQSLGVAIGGVVFQNRMYANLLSYPSLAPMAMEYSQDAASIVKVIQTMPDTPDKLYIKQAYTDSLRIVWAVCAALCGVGMILSFFTEEYDINRELSTTQGIIDNKESPVDEEGLNK